MFQCKDCDVAYKFISLLKGHFDHLHDLNVEFVIKYTTLTDHKDAINKTNVNIIIISRDLFKNGIITDKRYMFFNQMVISKLQCGVGDKTDKVD